jgi:hypothetical protein
VSQILEVATALDPRFKNLPFMTETDKPILQKKLREMLFAQVSATQADNHNKESPNKKPRLSGNYILKPLKINLR